MNRFPDDRKSYLSARSETLAGRLAVASSPAPLASLDVTITHPVTLTGWHQAVGFEDSNGESKFPPLSDVLATSSGNGLQLPGGGLPVDTTDTNNNEPPFTLEWSYHNNLQADSLIYYIYDHLGNTRVTYSPKLTNCGWYWEYQIIEGIIVDSTWTNGTGITYTLENVVDYYPYGKVLREYKNGEEKYLTTYHQRDDETGLDYRGARYYDADVPRFFSLDPDAQNYHSNSSYSYVLGNPIALVDPDGKNARIATRKEGDKTIITISSTVWLKGETRDGNVEKIQEQFDVLNDSYEYTIDDGEFAGDYVIEIDFKVKVYEGEDQVRSWDNVLEFTDRTQDHADVKEADGMTVNEDGSTNHNVIPGNKAYVNRIKVDNASHEAMHLLGLVDRKINRGFNGSKPHQKYGPDSPTGETDIMANGDKFTNLDQLVGLIELTMRENKKVYRLDNTKVVTNYRVKP